MRNILEEMQSMQEEMGQLFHTVFESRGNGPLRIGPGSKEMETYNPASLDLKETDKEIIAAFDLPGIDKKDIELSVAEGKIVVKAQKKEEQREERKGYFRHERSERGFFRMFALPVKVKPEEVHAEYKDGVLTVTMPKLEALQKKKEKMIEVR